ncbi:MAG: hypothetical protein DRO99_02230 [Candidatus Aenigmatarchaeota archaeon]|nr:MAG: hypothetical protein DRO99_02230 [Candidatus Aenigmarchaeota archaeon]
MAKTVVGITESVTIIAGKNVKTYAVFDTGARLTSIDIKLAGEAQVGPIIRTTKVKNPSLKVKTTRPVVLIKVRIKGKVYECEANIQDRSHMTAPMIIGRNVIAGNFIVDASKNLKKFNEMRRLKGMPESHGIRRIADFSGGKGTKK